MGQVRQTYVYTGEILVIDKGETAPVIERYLEKDPATPAAQVQGRVLDSKGKAVPNAYVIASKKGTYKQTVLSHGKEEIQKDILQPFVWKIADAEGKFSFRLPKDEYQFHVEARGYTPSDAKTLTLTKDIVTDFTVNDGAKAIFAVYDQNNTPINAKVEVQGTVTTVSTLGGAVFFAGAENKTVEFAVAAPENELSFIVTHDSDFESLPVVIKKTVKPREVITEKVVIPRLINAKSRHWYNADNHQHSDIGDGATSIEDLYRAQLAAGLDLHIVSDHDSMGNNPKMAELSKGGKPFISSVEISPGWGHWNILQADYSKPPISPDLTPAEIIAAGHAQGALVVMNHPYTDYGFLNNRDGVRGGHDKGSDDFDFLELQSTIDLSDDSNMDKKALDSAMDYWNKGKKIYLSAGSDQHNARSGLYPGKIRMYAYMPEGVSVKNYLRSMKAGSTYVTMGPIIFPDSGNMFGSTVTVKSGEPLTLSHELQAVHGLMDAVLVSGGNPVDKKEFGNTLESVPYEVRVTPQKSTWYSLIVRDGKGRYAVTNPIWVEVS